MNLPRVILPADVPRAANIQMDAGVFAFALAVSAAAGLLFRSCRHGVRPAGA